MKSKTFLEKNFINVQAYKYNGDLYRQWNGSKIIKNDSQNIILYNFHSRIMEKSGKSWQVSEPSLWIFPKNENYNVNVLLRPEGNYYYINLTSPFIFEDNTIKYIDFDIDIKVYPKKEIEIVDIKEFQKNIKDYGYPPSVRKMVYKQVQNLLMFYEKQTSFFHRDFIDKIVNSLAKNKMLVFQSKKLSNFSQRYFEELRKNTKNEKIFKVYLCGPTVYDEVHIGNMRSVVVVDLIVRAQKYLGKKTLFVHNITDIDDKIIERSIQSKISENKISEKYFREYKKVLKKYRIKSIDKMPKVTDNIDSIVKFINSLDKKGYVIQKDDGFVFDVSKIKNYGKRLSREDKKQVENFYLWKSTTKGVQYNYNGFLGRPGWHSECTLFIDDIFNSQTLDIHAGGIDLTFPHHENENAQYIAKNDVKITKHWLHVGQVMFKNQKMSKSLGNVILAKDFDEDIFKIILINSSVTAPIYITNELIENAKVIINKYKKLYFKFLNLSLSFNFDDNVRYMVRKIADKDFSSFNLKLNEYIKAYNTSLEADKLTIVSSVIHFLNFSFIEQIEKDFRKNKKIYDIWQGFLKQKNYEKADMFRKILIDQGLI